MSATMPPHRSIIARTFSASANRCSISWRNTRPANCRSMPIWKCCRCWRRAIIRSRRRRRAIPGAAASPWPWSTRLRVRDAASTRAFARITSPAAAPAKRSRRRCARPRPVSGCPMRLPCRSSWSAPEPGLRHPDQDYLYADELKAFAASGIAELHTAFSRAEGPKTYVQNLVAAQQDRVWSLIEDGAIIYVCGDGGKMEPDVKAAMVAIYRERKGADAEAGLRWIDDLGTSNRYVLDVWAGG